MVVLLTRPATGLHHADRVQAIVEGRSPATSGLDVSSSWNRCASEHGLDPEAKEAPRILTSRELKDHREPLDRLIATAGPELDRLHAVVGQARYVVLLCDARGVAVDFRAGSADADQFRHWAIYLGGLWDEKVEGTNGIGTAIAELRPITVHRSQHFRCRHIDLSCSSAPITDGDGRLVAVLDVSCFDPTLSDRAHALAGALVHASARTIEKQFVEQSATSWSSGPFYQRGGLPPGALKRVREYIEGHLADRISVERLAAIAGLSVYHFARTFKKSQGMTPHDYLLDRRIRRARALLDATDTALSEIALVTGFADQSHFARHFRQRIGVPPNAYRRSQQHATRR
jgi:transcriptional regulator of acetoin/glycerol metabolism